MKPSPFPLPHRLRRMALAFIPVAALASASAHAQSASEPGPYVVARAGMKVGSETKIAKPDGTAAAPGLHNKKIDGNSSLTGEIGGGYDFGGFRLETTAGYSSTGVNGKSFSDKTNIGSGRMKSFDVGISGYVDLLSGSFKPYLGGGIGMSRVSYTIDHLARSTTKPAPGAKIPGSHIKDSDWGTTWHLDAGAGYEVSPGTTLELAGRYSRTGGIDMKGTTILNAAGDKVELGYKARASSTSVMIGVRQKF